jgi:DNA-binding transcriptional ArsR family regulator
MATSYKRIDSSAKTLQVLDYLMKQKDAQTAKDLAAASGLPMGTLMTHLVTLEDEGWIERIHEYYRIDNPAYIRRAPKGSGRTRPQTIRGRCSSCGNPDVSIAKRHPQPICGRCKNLQNGLTAGGKQRHAATG